MFHIVWELQRIVHISATRCLIEIWFTSKCSLNEKVVYIRKIKIEHYQHVTHPLDRVMIGVIRKIFEKKNMTNYGNQN